MRITAAAGALAAAVLFLPGCEEDGGGTPPAAQAPPAAPPTAPRHLVLVSIDTLRADCLAGPRGASLRRAWTPVLDALAKEGAALANAHSHVPLTLPSHATLFTGQLPPALALHDNAPFPLRGDVPTLAQLLQSAGFATDAVIGGQPLARGCGLERGFDRYDDPPRGETGSARFGERTAAEVTDRALAAWAAVGPENGVGRRFLFVHYFDPHAPYAPPRDVIAGDPSDPVAAYLGEIAYVDRELARLLAALRKSGERCLVVVTSDHGEGLGDHGERTHGYQLFESTLHVPLIAAEIEGDRTAVPAGLRATDRARLVGLIDLLPTLLRELGVAPPDGLPGAPLQEPAPADATCYVESLASSLQFGWAQVTGVRGRGATLLRAGADVPGAPAVIDGIAAIVAGEADERLLVDDAAAAPAAEELSDWRSALAQARAAAGAVRLEEAPAATIAPLTAIGYVGGATDRARHQLLPLDANALLPSPLWRRAEIDALLRAVEQLEAGDALAAVAATSALLAADPGNRAARFFRARARLDRHHPPALDGRPWKEAAEDLDELLKLEPTYAGAALLRAKALGLAGEFEPAFAQLAALTGDGARPDAESEHLLGSLLLQKRSAGRLNPRFDAEQGYAHLLRSLELDPSQEALAASIATRLKQLAAEPAPPAWVAAAIERLQRRRRRRYPLRTGRYRLPFRPAPDPRFATARAQVSHRASTRRDTC